MELLERAIAIDRAAVEGLCREKAFVLEQTLNEFRLEVQVVAIETGPVITVFELKLAPGIKWAVWLLSCSPLVVPDRSA